MKKFFKNNILGFILGAIIFGGIGIVYAAVYASSINYSNTKSGLKDSNGNNIANVQDAIDELYKRVGRLINYQNIGDQVILDGYYWHVIGEDDTKVWLLLDAGQLPDMNHCTDDLNNQTDCTYTGSYYAYSWEKSKIRTYLNSNAQGGFLNSLSDNVKNKLVATQVCKDLSISSGTLYTYGGYTKEEIELLSSQGATCTNGYTSDYVRLISESEYYNLTPYYSNTSYPVSSENDNRKGYYPKLSYISKVPSNEWIYPSPWWTMSANSNSYVDHTRVAKCVDAAGFIGADLSHYSKGVRPVIVLQK